VSLAKKLIFRLINCREAMTKSSRYVDGELSWWDCLKLRLHLSQCWCCARFVRQLPLLGQFCRKLDDCEEAHDHLSNEARDRIKASLHDDK
jgi:hypothetical protein